MKQPESKYRDSMLWSAVQAIVAELTSTGEIAVKTAPDYVIAYICHELVAKKAVTEAALSVRRAVGES